MVRHLERPSGLAWLAMGLLLAGCGGGEADGLPRQAVWGTVSIGGQPLEQGRIVFEPASPTAGPPAGGEIKGGEYAIPRDQGPTPGDYRVMITSAGEAPAGSDLPPGAEEVQAPRGTRAARAARAPRAAPELIPQEYNSKTTLTAKVEADKDNKFEFTLKQ